LGVPRIIDEDLRLSYVLWEEQKVPIMTLEVVSHKRRKEYTQKRKIFIKKWEFYTMLFIIPYGKENPV
jgi:hypothetical protein